ncbi:MAG TPA: hypothetical protein VFT69_04820 [Pseudolabrys sp.]|jgi:hypothetical protein|nr:hypothetical protein [Pseudolabrys sp.]
MSNAWIQAFLDRHGADPARWPGRERPAAERLITGDRTARAAFEAARRLDATLTRGARIAADNSAAVERIMAKLSGPLPPQRMPLWRLPAVLLDWQFAPAWPRMAALACCAVLGFAIGLSGVDRHIDGQSLTAQQMDLASAVFEPEPLLAGRRP